jgi:hypothetical protein
MAAGIAACWLLDYLEKWLTRSKFQAQALTSCLLRVYIMCTTEGSWHILVFDSESVKNVSPLHKILYPPFHPTSLVHLTVHLSL